MNKKHPTIKLGDKFTRLVVVARSTREGEPRWTCRCDCGTTREILERSLKAGHTRSCGCLHIESSSKNGKAKKTHGHSVGRKLTPEYRAWRSMRRRVLDKNCPDYPNYGGRGITICARWRDSFEAFFADMGVKPFPSYTIERRKNDRGYEMGNCYWASRKVQNRNKRNNVQITINNITRTMSEWAEISGVKVGTLQRRVKANWPSRFLLEPPKLGRRINALCQ